MGPPARWWVATAARGPVAVAAGRPLRCHAVGGHASTRFVFIF